MREGAEGAPGAVAGVLDVVALGALVDLRVELLLGPRVTVLARVPGLAVGGVAPLVGGLDLRAGRGAVLELLRAPALVLPVMELRAGVSLAAEPRGLLAGLRLVVGEHVGGVQPLGVVVDEGALLVEAVEPDDGVNLAGFDGLELPEERKSKRLRSLASVTTYEAIVCFTVSWLRAVEFFRDLGSRRVRVSSVRTCDLSFPLLSALNAGGIKV